MNWFTKERFAALGILARDSEIELPDNIGMGPRVGPVPPTHDTVEVTMADDKLSDTGKYIAAEVRAVLEEFKKDTHQDLSQFKQEVRDDMRGLNKHVKESTEVYVRAQEANGRQMTHLTRVVSSLWRDTHGSEPPPPPPHDDAAMSFVEAANPSSDIAGSHSTTKDLVAGELAGRLDPQVQKISEHDASIAGVQGQLITVSATANQALKNSEELLALQKEQMGKKEPGDERGVFTRLVDGLVWVVKEREGQKFALMLLAGITSLVTALGTTYALMTGRLPMPTSLPQNPPALHSNE